MTMKRLGLALVMVLAATASASAETQLGEQGALSINGNLEVDLGVETNNDDVGSMFIRVAPNGDYFVTPSLSVGGGASVELGAIIDGGDFVDCGVQGRVGYYLPFGSMGLWLQAGASYDHGHYRYQESDVYRGVDRLSLDLYAPLVIHPVPHFFIGLGPVFSRDLFVAAESELGPDAKRGRIAVTSLIGGVW